MLVTNSLRASLRSCKTQLLLTSNSNQVWGALGCLNHYFCHVRTHARPIPWVYKQGQDWGLLPSAKHHKTHHTSPFEENWNFLVGGHIVYE